MMKLLSAVSFASLNLLADAVIIDPTAYGMEHEVKGHNFFFLANKEIQHDWHTFSTGCGECDAIGPAWAEIMRCYKQDEKVFVGKVLANFPFQKNDYWRTVIVDGVNVGKDDAPNVTEEHAPPIFFYGGDANAPTQYKGLKDRFSLYKFLEGHLGPCCGPKNLELCHDVAERLKFEKLLSKSTEDLLRMLEKMQEKDTASDTKERDEMEELMDETERIDEAGNLSISMKQHLQRKFGSIEDFRRKSFQGIDSAIAAIRRTLDAKGYEVKVAEDEFDRRAVHFQYVNGENEYD